MEPASTCARRGAAPDSNTTRLASTSTGARPNNTESVLPFIAVLLALAGQTHEKREHVAFKAAPAALKRAPSTHKNFVDRGLNETRGKPPHDSVLRIQHPKPTESVNRLTCLRTRAI